MTLKERLEERLESGGPAKRRFEKKPGELAENNLKETGETAVTVSGRPVRCVEYETAPFGDFVKICADGHEAGVIAEYAWFAQKYPGSTRLRQKMTCIHLNGKKARCDILTIQTDRGERDIYFDISEPWEVLQKQMAAEEEQIKR